MNKARCVGIAVGLAVTLQGCGALVVKSQTARKQIQQDLPAVGATSRVELGEKMMVQNDYEAVVGASVPLTRVSLSGAPHDLNGFYEISADRHYCGVVTSRTFGSDGRQLRVCFTETEFKGYIPSFQTTEMIISRPGNLQRVIEYTGRVDNRITFSYREYNETKDGAFIRPAYTQDFTFDLSQGPEIGLKGARVKVLDATNTGITYQVLKHFPK